MPLGLGEPSEALSNRIRSILATRGLHLAELARRSRLSFPRDRRFHIPPNLFHLLQRKAFSPSIHQIFALSQLCDYRMADWLTVFGLMLHDITRLQAVLPARYTTLLDPGLYDSRTWMMRFEETGIGHLSGPLRPLGERVHLRSARDSVKSEAFYAKIGALDAFAFPDLLPGSIVRITGLGHSSPTDIPAGRNGALFLVEHTKGLTCSRLHFVDKNRVVLYPTQLPFAQVEFRLGREARILGVVDFELRPTSFRPPPGVPDNLHQFWTPEPLEENAPALSLDKLLILARRRSGLTFREASASTALIARILESRDYFCSPGALSDYESQIVAPRDTHKMISLCALYSLSAWEFMTLAGVPLAKAGKEPLPDEFLTLGQPGAANTTRAASLPGSPVLAEFPYFFGHTIAEHLKMHHLSIRDMFLMTDAGQHFHPYLADAAVLIVDRRKKRIRTIPQAPLWAQPLYVLVQRNGRFVCTACMHEGKKLVLRPFSDGFDRPLRPRSPAEVEVVGEVAAILRRALPGSL